jgi:hypothetical protein
MDAEHWQLEPDEHDFPAARTYLSLICDPAYAAKIVKLLQRASTSSYQAKDLLRASRLPLLEETNKHVSEDLQKVASGQKLSPILLVRGRFEKNRDLVIADGYHRVCASFHTDENTDIPVVIVPSS